MKFLAFCALTWLVLASAVGHSGTVLKKMALGPKPLRLTQEQWLAVRRGRIQALVNHFNTEVQSSADLEKEMFQGAKESYLQSVRPILKNLGNPPTLKRDGEQIVMRFADKTELTFRFDFGTNRAYVDDVAIVFDKTAPWKPQFEKILRDLKTEKNKSAYIFDLLIPRAYAFGAVVGKTAAKCAGNSKCSWAVALVAGSYIAGAGSDFKEGTYSGFCWVLSPLRPWENIGWCGPWKIARDDYSKKLAKEAVARQTFDPRRDWGTDTKIDCPNGEYFATWMQEIYDGKDTGNVFRYFAKTKASAITEAYVFDDAKADIANPDDATIKFVYTQDTPPQLQSIVFKNEDYNPNSSQDVQWLTFYPSDDPATIKPEKYRDRLAKQIQFASVAQTWANTCGQMAKTAKRAPEAAAEAAQNMMSQPVKPVDGSPTPTTVPAASDQPVSTEK